MAAEYVFIDEWDVSAPIEAVFDALADARTYPKWWTPVYIEVESDAAPAVGRKSFELFKGRLPYRLRMTSEIVRIEPPHEFEIACTGDLRGGGVWTLTQKVRRRPHQVRLARVRRQTPLARADTAPAAAFPGESQLRHLAGESGIGGVRPQQCVGVTVRADDPFT